MSHFDIGAGAIKRPNTLAPSLACLEYGPVFGLVFIQPTTNSEAAAEGRKTTRKNKGKNKAK